jgi:hypothetical protein
MALLAGRHRTSTPKQPGRPAPAALAAPLVELICLACGALLPGSLANGGALRCQDCRSADAALDGNLVALQRSLAGGGTA